MADALNARWIPLLCRRVSPGFSLAGRTTSSPMNYFYYYALTGALGGSVQRVLRKPPCPLLFLHGSGTFHTTRRGLRRSTDGRCARPASSAATTGSSKQSRAARGRRSVRGFTPRNRRWGA